MTLDEAIKYYEKASKHMEQFFGSANSTVECRQLVEWLKQVPRWISVDDRLPDNIKDVIVCDEFGITYPAYYHAVYKCWMYSGFEHNRCGHKITHWMPLPQLPKRDSMIDEDYIACVQSQIEMLKVDRDDWKTKFELLKRENDKLKEDYADLNCHYAATLDKINELENQWIKCSDRLPDDYKDVLVWFEYFRYGDYNRLFQRYGIGNHVDKTWYINGETGWRQLRVIAWQKLPQPPKSEE